jgi:hypothetical protein
MGFIQNQMKSSFFIINKNHQTKLLDIERTFIKQYVIGLKNSV